MKCIPLQIIPFILCATALASPFQLALDADRLVIPSTGSTTPREKIHYLNILNGASDNLFEGPPLEFPNVRQIGISAPSSVDKHLNLLAKNYSWLKCLSINQKTTISESGIRCLESFRLEQLGVDFPTTRPTTLLECIPKTVTSLYFGPNSNATGAQESFLSLPDLCKLDIRGTQLENEFLKRSSLPNLTRLNLVNVIITDGQLEGLENCPRLRRITLYKTFLNDSTLKEIRTRRIVVRDR